MVYNKKSHDIHRNVIAPHYDEDGREGGETMRRILILMSLFTLLLGIALPAFSQEMTADEIVRKAEDIMRGSSNVGVMSMHIINPNWERTLEMKYWEKGKDRSLVRITAPAREAGTISLKVENNMWNYLPSVERVIKVEPSMMMQSWMGSDFTNDDLVRESSIVDDYDPTLVGTEVLEEGEAYVLDLVAKPEAPVVWGKITLYIRAEDFAPLRYEYFDEDGEMIRVMYMSDIERIDGRSYPMVWTMVPVKEEGKMTIITVHEIQFDVPIDDNIFNYSNLRRGIVPE
jgi:outer membrane lipoprotein-sorting protein